MSHLEVHAHLKIRPGQVEGFKAQAAEILRLVASGTRKPFATTGSSTWTEQSARYTRRISVRKG